jgi:hypothetical protein
MQLDATSASQLDRKAPNMKQSRFSHLFYKESFMNFNARFLVLGFVFSSFGMIYFNYGRKQKKYLMLVAGMILVGYPYFLDSVVWLTIWGSLLLALPFVVRRWG